MDTFKIFNKLNQATSLNEEDFQRGQDPKTAMNIGLVDQLTQKTQDAFSASRYGDEWGKIIGFLLEKELSPEAIEWILRSKHMRWAGDSMEYAEDRPDNVMSVEGFQNYLNNNKNDIQSDLGLKPWLAEDMGGASAPMSTLGNTPGMGTATPAATATTGSMGASNTGSGDRWDASIGPMNTQAKSVNEMNINPHDKLGVAMAQKMGIDIPFKKGKGDKDVEQKEIDEDIDLSTELVSFEEWAKKFINEEIIRLPIQK